MPRRKPPPAGRTPNERASLLAKYDALAPNDRTAFLAEHGLRRQLIWQWRHAEKNGRRSKPKPPVTLADAIAIMRAKITAMTEVLADLERIEKL